MSLGIAFKGPEGIVLAADSRVTLTASRKQGDQIHLLPAYFDNATKLLGVNGFNHVGAVTYGLGAFGELQPRTAHSFLPEFEEYLQGKYEKKEDLSVEEFAKELSNFFMKQWDELMPKEYTGLDMVFLVGGYDTNEAYGKIFELHIPSQPDPREQQNNDFGITWGGQLEITNRLLLGYDPSLLKFLDNEIKISDADKAKLFEYIKGLNLPIPYPFLPLQDCVDLSMYMIRTTMEIQNWMVGTRGVGGAIDVATITRTNGFCPVQQKQIRGERK